MSSMTFQGTNVDELLGKLTALTSKRDAFEIIGAYLSDVALGTRRPPFDYQTPFAADDPDCVASFTRSFVHSDWRDGQDLVQAEQTSGEDGFNLRFHRIEEDLDALSDDIKTVFHCVAEVRTALASILGEVRAAINILQADIADLESRPRTGGGPILTAPPQVNQGKVLGTVNWFDKGMIAFETPQGITLLPKVEPIDGGTDPRIDRVSALATLFAENKQVTDKFGAGTVTAKQLATDFGTVTAGGYNLAGLVDILPPDASFSSPDALVNAVAERQAAAIRTSGRADDFVASLGGDGNSQPAASVKLDGFDPVPAEVRTALVVSGVNTVGDLANSKPEEVVNLLQAQGVTAAAPTVAGWIAGAQTVSLIR
jgi:hypothetical protein